METDRDIENMTVNYTADVRGAMGKEKYLRLLQRESRKLWFHVSMSYFSDLRRDFYDASEQNNLCLADILHEIEAEINELGECQEKIARLEAREDELLLVLRAKINMLSKVMYRVFDKDSILKMIDDPPKK